MSFGDCRDFQEFIQKNGMTRQEGIEYLKKELHKLGAI